MTENLHDVNCEWNRPGWPQFAAWTDPFTKKDYPAGPYPCHCLARLEGRRKAERELREARPGDVLLEIRYLPGILVAWDPNGEMEIARVFTDEYTEDGEAFRAGIRALGNAIAENRGFVEGD